MQEELKIKLDNVLKKNPGFERIKTIAGVISGTTSTLPEGIRPWRHGHVQVLFYCQHGRGEILRHVQEHHV